MLRHMLRSEIHSVSRIHTSSCVLPLCNLLAGAQLMPNDKTKVLEEFCGGGGAGGASERLTEKNPE